MIVSILSSIPLWVFPLFLGLCFLGARAMRKREVPVLLIYALPLLGLLSLDRARGLEHAELSLAVLAVAWAAGGAAGHHLQARWTLGRSIKHVRLAGEWGTMLCLMGLFCANFATGMVQGMSPDLANGQVFAVLYGTWTGSLSGMLAGRALHVALTPVSLG